VRESFGITVMKEKMVDILEYWRLRNQLVLQWFYNEAKKRSKKKK